MRSALILTVAGVTIACSGVAAHAQTRQGAYGGGFIEYLMTGAAPSAAAQQRARLRDDGVLPVHPSAYGYGGPSAIRYRSADPYAQADEEAFTPRTRLAALPPRTAPVDLAIGQAMDPRFEKQVVSYAGSQRPGTIVIDTGAKFLYLVQSGNQAIRYGIGVGRPGFLWHGTKTITAKREWPDWTPPAEMLLRRPDLPRHMTGGPANPLGARAMYLGSSLYRIHGTNEPHTIGQAVSSGCIRMMNEDVVDLYARTPIGTRVDVI